MKKYLIIGMFIINILHGMENSSIPEIHSICKWTHQNFQDGLNPLGIAHYHIINKYSLDNLKIFNMTRNEGFADFLAQKSGIVHSVDEIGSEDITITQQKYNRDNLFFMNDSDENDYDLLTAFYLSNKEIELHEDLLAYKEKLKPSGEIFGSIITQSNKDSIEQLLAEKIYEEIYNSLTQEQKNNIEKSTYSKTAFITQKSLECIVQEAGYEIISQTNRFFDFYIQDIFSFKKLLEWGCEELLLDKFKECLSLKRRESYRNNFIIQAIESLKKNEESALIYPYNVTEIHLRKK